MVPRMPNRQYAYFRDDQLVFLLTHSQDRLSEADLRSWRDDIQQHLDGAEIIWPPRWFSFRNLGDNEYLSSVEDQRFLHPFSIVVCDMDKVPVDPLKFLTFISDLSNQNAGLIGNTFEGLKTEAMSPNWLASGASQSGGTGGPGGWPVPFRGDPSRAPYQFRDLISRLKDQEMYGEGEGVDIAILDTAPCPHDLVAAYKECKNWHPLIHTLLGPNGKLKLYPATYEQCLRMGSTSLNKHDYKMNDHGLFVAGIIHSIVPQATIHLVEVLNPFGVGDLESLAGGLQKVFEEIYQKPDELSEAEEPQKPRQKLVINSSWMLELPSVEAHLQALSYTDPEYEFERAVWHLARDDENQALVLKAECDRFSALGRQVIAAAGNDWKEKSPRTAAPATRFPAAFLSTLGVGALPKDSRLDESNNRHKASSYSNIADVPDRPDIKRIVTLGGEAGEGQGVLGLYLGEFPGCEPKPNCTRWAWWAGTSFATPILTGTIAAVLSSPNPSQTTQEAVNDLYTGRIIDLTRGQTDANEDVLNVAQEY
jgi:hypothetical protein